METAQRKTSEGHNWADPWLTMKLHDSESIHHNSESIHQDHSLSSCGSAPLTKTPQQY